MYSVNMCLIDRMLLHRSILQNYKLKNIKIQLNSYEFMIYSINKTLVFMIFGCIGITLITRYYHELVVL